MAAISSVTTFPEPKTMQLAWPAVVAANTWTASQCGLRYPDKIVTVEGTFDSATVLIVGSNDGTNYHTCHGQAGILSFTVAGGDVIVENYPYLKATHSGGGGSESIVITITGTSY